MGLLESQQAYGLLRDRLLVTLKVMKWCRHEAVTIDHNSLSRYFKLPKL